MKDWPLSFACYVENPVTYRPENLILLADGDDPDRLRAGAELLRDGVVRAVCPCERWLRNIDLDEVRTVLVCLPRQLPPGWKPIAELYEELAAEGGVAGAAVAVALADALPGAAYARSPAYRNTSAMLAAGAAEFLDPEG